MKRETSQRAGTSPVFSASEEGEKGGPVCDVRSALRYKPLPDLFGGSLPKKTAAPQAAPPAVPAVPEKSESKEKKKKEIPRPVVSGAVHEGETHLVILKWQGQTAACAAGEWWNGWYIAYINSRAVGLQHDEEFFEISL